METKPINFNQKIFKICLKCNIEKEHSTKGKICIDCKKEYDLKYIKLNKESRTSKNKIYREKTKISKRAYDKSYRSLNKEEILKRKQERKNSGLSSLESRKSALKTKYGLSLEDYTLLEISQEGKCKICKTTNFPGVGNRLHVDHCHITGKIRGLLCKSCNNALGLFKDNIKILEEAIKYLKENERK